MLKLKDLLGEGLSSKWYKDTAKDFVGEYKHAIIQRIKNEGYADVQQMVVDTVRSLQYDPVLRGKISADKLHDTVETLLHKQSWWKKLTGIREGTVYYDVYSNNRGSDANVYANKDLGKSPREGFYAEIDNRYDKGFKNKAETEKLLKKNNYKHIGVDKDHY